jgi:hypothetical protein
MDSSRSCRGVVATGDRAAELALRFSTRVFPGTGSRSPDLRAALDRVALANPSEELVVLPTYTAMLALQSSESSANAAVLERAA